MTAEKFIEDYLSQCDDTIICLHSPDDHRRTTFSIHEYHCERMTIDLIHEVSQIASEVENSNDGSHIVFHIYTKYVCEAP